MSVSVFQVACLLSELNPEQLEAAEAIDGAILVIAGAGSGKTKSLTARIANLQGKGIEPKNMFVATFTNKAAREMKDRIAKAVGQEAVNDLWMGTFHSLCVRILRKYAHLLGYNPKNEEGKVMQFTITDTYDTLQVAERVFKIMNIDNIKPGYLLHYIDDAKNNLWDPQYCLLHKARDDQEAKLAMAYEKYQYFMKSSNCMDFGDLIANTVYLLENFPNVREYYQSKFQYVMSDEYQDSNIAQLRLLQHLAYPQNNIWVCGDPSQSIYKFRGGDIGIILSFEKMYQNPKVVKLERNYRSKNNVVQAGNAIIQHNKLQTKFALLNTPKEDGEPIKQICLQDEYREAAYITYEIQRRVKEGKNQFSDFTILFRNSYQSAPIEKMFISAFIPHQIVGNSGFYQREEIKDLICYLRAIYNRKDDTAMLRILNKPTRGIGDTTQDLIVEYANTHQVSIHRALRTAEDIATLKKPAIKKIRDFLHLLDHLESMKHREIHTFVQYILDQTGYMNMWENSKHDKKEEKLDNIREFIRLVGHYETENPDKGMEDFLEEIALLTDFNQGEQENAVKMMTIHASKGLEFPVVFLVGCNEQVFPGWRSQSDEDIEEERRLAYVAITRAEEECQMTYTLQRQRTNGKGMQNYMPSRFLNEIPASIVFSLDLTQTGRVLSS